MILRRVREHVAHHNWFAVAIDLAVVIVGVFFGMQVNNWNQARLDRRQAHEYREMLIDDLQTNQKNLALRKRYYQWVRREALKTLAAMAEPPSALGEQFLVDSYQASQILPWSLKRSTYDQIIAAGDIGHLGDAALRDQIGNYYVGADTTGANLATVMSYHETLRRAMPYAAQLVIRTDCGEKIGENAQGEPEMTLPEDCKIRLDPAIVRQAVDQVRGMPGLSLDLNRQLVDLDQKLISVDGIARRSRALEHALEQAR
jgi:hypothetical protein